MLGPAGVSKLLFQMCRARLLRIATALLPTLTLGLLDFRKSMFSLAPLHSAQTAGYPTAKHSTHYPCSRLQFPTAECLHSIPAVPNHRVSLQRGSAELQSIPAETNQKVSEYCPRPTQIPAEPQSFPAEPLLGSHGGPNPKAYLRKIQSSHNPPRHHNGSAWNVRLICLQAGATFRLTLLKHSADC